MMPTPATLLAMAALALLAAPAAALDTSALKPDQMRGAIEVPKNPAHQHIHDRLKQQRVLERIGEFLSPFRLPREVTMKVEGCDGTVNAFYDEAVITVC